MGPTSESQKDKKQTFKMKNPLKISYNSFNFILFILSCLDIVKYSQSYYITVDARDEQCFFDKVKQGTKMGLIFEVAEGGALGIDMEIGEAPDPSEENVDHNKLEEQIKELSQSLTGAKHEQEYMEVRDRIHRAVNENTNTRVVMWS